MLLTRDLYETLIHAQALKIALRRGFFLAAAHHHTTQDQVLLRLDTGIRTLLDQG
jgi:hypothetical protein